MRKKSKVVMLPIEKGGVIRQNRVNKGLIYQPGVTWNKATDKSHNPHHLYLILEDKEEWHPGDFIHTTNVTVERIKAIDKEYSTQPGYEWLITVEGNGNQYKPCEIYGKIVSTTDSLLHIKKGEWIEERRLDIGEFLPGVPESFIEAFVRSGGTINEVLIEGNTRVLCTEGENCAAVTNSGELCKGTPYEAFVPRRSEDNRVILYNTNPEKEMAEMIAALCDELEGNFKTDHTWDLVNKARELIKIHG